MIIERMRIYLTENCNANCPFCINANSRSKQNMDFDKYIKLCKYLSANNVNTLCILGGEPTEHPNFTEMWDVSHNYFKSLILFTNGSNRENLFNIDFRTNDVISINYNFHKNFDEIIEQSNGIFNDIRGFDAKIILHDNTDIQQLLKNVYQSNELLKKNNIKNYKFYVSLDCTENIFIEDKFIKYNEQLCSIIDFCKEFNIPIGTENKIPFCCISGLTLSKLNENNIKHYHYCNFGDGVITSDFNLEYCLNYNKNQLKLFSEQNEIDIEFDDVKRWLITQHNERINEISKTKCLDCRYFLEECNGGCWAHKFEDRFDCKEIYWKTMQHLVTY